MNNFNNFKQWIDERREIEFTLKNKNYSVTYGTHNDGTKYISFCEFYKSDTEFISADDFMKNAMIDNILLSDLWNEAKEIIIY